MKKLERKFSKSERIIAKVKFSYFVFFREFLLAGFLGGVLAVVWVFNQQIEGVFTKDYTKVLYLTEQNLKWALLAIAGVVLICTILHEMSFNSKELIVTEDKIVYRSGIINVKSVMLPLVEIRMVENKQNFFQRLFKCGSILIISDAEKPYKIENIVSPNKFANKIMKQMSLVHHNSSANNIRLQLESGEANKYRHRNERY